MYLRSPVMTRRKLKKVKPTHHQHKKTQLLIKSKTLLNNELYCAITDCRMELECHPSALYARVFTVRWISRKLPAWTGGWNHWNKYLFSLLQLELALHGIRFQYQSIQSANLSICMDLEPDYELDLVKEWQEYYLRQVSNSWLEIRPEK